MVSPIAVTRSIVAADALGEIIAEEYDLGAPLNCKLISKMLRTQDNEHYLVRSGDVKYVARVYQLGQHLQRQESDYLYELDWLNFLKAKEQPVSYPIARRDGGFLGQLEAPEGRRYYAVFSFARGKPMVADDEDQLFSMGRRMAQIHLASNNYEPSHERRRMGLSFLVDEPVARLERFWARKRDAKLDILLTSAEEAKEQIETLLKNEEETEDGWGAIGGDFHPYNTHFDGSDEPTFFSFDLCGLGWRAYDIAVFLLNADLMRRPSNLSEAFFAGYYAARPLSRNEHEAIAPFLTIRRV
ncbi:MAG TPA: phosphotransferase, partial [Anaerolineae bacterium]|nr:phosphotransferase [Anaerolineae bacterium]